MPATAPMLDDVPVTSLLADEPERAPVHVLLVDDDVAYRTLCSRYLARDARHDYRVISLSSGAETAGIDLTSFDCILVDYFLPDCTGTELIARWRDNYPTTLPPVVVMSAGGGEQAAIEAVRTHATDYLAKGDLTANSLQRSIGNATEKGELRRIAQERQRELKRTHATLERRTVEIQRFYHTVSHEMKTPLTATREFVAIVRDGLAGEVSDQQRELLEHALDSCDQITRQFDDLIDLTRMETGKLRLETGDCTLVPVIERCMAMATSAAAVKGVLLETSIEDDLTLVHMDAGRIAQVLSNLIGNAIKFTDAGGCVQVRATRKALAKRCGGRVDVRVTDSGRGIAKADRARVFDRLYQVSRHSTEVVDSGDGLGLGLSISREIVRAHGGELVVHSRLGVGSTFRFSLAAAEPAAVPSINEVPERTQR